MFSEGCFILPLFADLAVLHHTVLMTTRLTLPVTINDTIIIHDTGNETCVRAREHSHVTFGRQKYARGPI